VDDFLQLDTNQDDGYFNDDTSLLKIEADKSTLDDNPSLLGAAFEQENLVVNAYQALDEPSFAIDESFDITDYDLTEYGEHRHEFYGAGSEDEVKFIAGKLEQNLINKQKIDEGGALGMLSLFAAGVADPTILIPVAGAAYKSTKAATIASGVIRGGASAAAVEIPREALLHANQPARTLDESVLNIAAVTTLSGAISGLVGGLSKGATNPVDNVVNDVVDDLVSDTPRTNFTKEQADDLAESVFDDSVVDTTITETAEQSANVIERLSATKKDVDDMYDFMQRMFGEMSIKFNDGHGMRDELGDKVKQIIDEIKNGGAIAEDIGLSNATLTMDDVVESVVDDFIPSTSKSSDKSTIKNILKESVDIAQGKIDINPDGDMLQMITESVDEAVSKAAKSKVSADKKAKTAAKKQKDKEKRIRSKLDRGRPDYEDDSYDLVKPSLMRWGLGPAIRLGTSKMHTVKKALYELQFDGYKRKGNMRPDDVETRIKAKESNKADFYVDVDVQYMHYADRMKGLGEPALKKQQFKYELAGAMRRGDVHAINEVAAAAKSGRKYIDDILNDAVDVGIFTKNVTVKHAMSYLPRMYDHQKIFNDVVKFKKLLREALDEEIADDIKDEITNSIFNNIIHGKVDIFDGKAAMAMPTKERVLTLSDEVLEEFFVNDVDTLIEGYGRALIPNIELKRKFGDTQGNSIFREMEDEYNNMIAGPDYVGSPNKIKALKKQFDVDHKNLTAIIHRLKQTTDNGLDANGGWFKAYKTAKTLNNTTMLGGVTVSSLPDLGRLILDNGLQRFTKTVFNSAAHASLSKMSRVEMKRMVAALEIHSGGNARLFADAEYGEFASNSKYLESLNWGETKFFQATLLPYYNQLLKTTSAMMTAGRMYDASKLLRAGKPLTDSSLKRLYHIGMDDDMITRIGQMIDDTPNSIVEDDVILLNHADWTDREAAEFVQHALIRDANQTILTPQSGDLPRVFDHWLGSLVFQFKSFAVLSHNKVLLGGLQRDDHARVAVSVLSMVAMGGIAAQLKSLIKDDELIEDKSQLAFEAVDRSGVLSLVLEANNITDKVTHGDYSINSIAGLKSPKRYSTRNEVGALLGPSFNTGANVFGLKNNLMEGGQSDARNRLIRKMTPLNNLFYLRWGFDELEGKK